MEFGGVGEERERLSRKGKCGVGKGGKEWKGVESGKVAASLVLTNANFQRRQILTRPKI